MGKPSALFLGANQLLLQPPIYVPFSRVLFEPLFYSFFDGSAEVSFLSTKYRHDCEPELSFCFITENDVHPTHGSSWRFDLLSL